MIQNVVIIGAGPAGLLLAHYLLHQGNYHIDIYERRRDPRLTDVSGDRTFPISPEFGISRKPDSSVANFTTCQTRARRLS